MTRIVISNITGAYLLEAATPEFADELVHCVKNSGESIIITIMDSVYKSNDYAKILLCRALSDSFMNEPWFDVKDFISRLKISKFELFYDL